MTYYFSKRHIPKCCPVCGAIDPFEKENLGLFDYIMTGWQVERIKKHPFWRFQCYKVCCMDCIFREEIMKKDYFLKHVPKQTWQPASIVVPLSGSNK